MSERTMQAQRAQDLANRREVAAFRLANAAAFAANMLTAEMHEPGRLSVRRDLWNALDEWRKLHGLPDGWPIDESLATPEPGGEGEQHRCGSCDAPVDDTGFIGHGVVRCQRCCEESVVGMGRPTPVASEDVRGDLRGWLVMAADLGRESDAPLETVADDVLVEIERDDPALLRTPRGEGEAAVWALTTDSHEAKTFVLQHVLRYWSPELQASLSAALRSEAQGEAFTPDMVEAVRFASGLFAAGEWGPVLARTAERMEALRGKGAE